MKQTSDKLSVKRTDYRPDDDNVRYKINTKHFNNLVKSSVKHNTKSSNMQDIVMVEDDENIRYKIPETAIKTKSPDKKPKPKSKIKVNFWSNKQSVKRLHSNVPVQNKTSRRHTAGAISGSTPSLKSKTTPVKVRKRVSFLPSPLFSDNHVPMVTVPDDLTIQLNEEEANDLGEDLNHAFVNSDSGIEHTISDSTSKKKARSTITQTSPRDLRQKRNNDVLESRTPVNDNELEFFSKYVVQKLRKMETNQRIYSENLINTVLMLGQLSKLSGKSKIGET